LFENAEGKRDLVSTEKVGQNLHRSKVSLVILSACQSAMVGDGADPLAMVAARLTSAGIPAVLAMTHSVLVHTTRTLFGEFYGHLARGRRIGESLDRARAFLQNHPQKYDVQRGPIRQKLELDDWFVPALYQSGDDVPLLNSTLPQPTHEPSTEPDTAADTALPIDGWLRPRHEAGFFSRRHELWDIECWFVGPTERISITGFGGQGKTELAQEAGR